MTQTIVTIGFNADVLKAIDDNRGYVPRSKYLDVVLREVIAAGLPRMTATTATQPVKESVAK